MYDVFAFVLTVDAILLGIVLVLMLLGKLAIHIWRH